MWKWCCEIRLLSVIFYIACFYAIMSSCISTSMLCMQFKWQKMNKLTGKETFSLKLTYNIAKLL